MGSSNTSANSNANNNNAVPVKQDLLKEIHEIRDLSDIDQLCAKQLKYLLARSCVDFKGIVEKEELRVKVRQLWIDHHERREKRRMRQVNNINRSHDSSDEIEYSQLCKICMEREIDCVLLECGHQFTCVTCGRKLAECPICRQNVVRCVRTFPG